MLEWEEGHSAGGECGRVGGDEGADELLEGGILVVDRVVGIVGETTTRVEVLVELQSNR